MNNKLTPLSFSCFSSLTSATTLSQTMQGKLNKCRFCRPDPSQDKILTIHYSNVDLLRQYISETGMILSRRVTSLCSSHQRTMRFAIKNARFLALLSYTSDWHVPYSYVNPAKYPAWRDQQNARDQDAAERHERKQADLELLASLRDGEERDAAVAAIKLRKGVVANYNPDIEAKLAHLPPLLTEPLYDRFAPPNARAPVADADRDLIPGMLAEKPSPAMLAWAAKQAAKDAQEEDAALFDPFWSPTEAADAGEAVANDGWVSDGELEFLRDAAATEPAEAKAALYADHLAAALRARLSQTVNREEARALAAELEELGVAGAEQLPDAMGLSGVTDVMTDALSDANVPARKLAETVSVPRAEEILRGLGIDVDALVAKDDGFDAVAWVEKLRQIQAANKLRDTKNPFDQGDRVEDLKALHRLGFTGPAKKI